MKIYTALFSITSWCIITSRTQTGMNSYVPRSISSISPHSFVSPTESSFGFSGPTGYSISGFSAPSKYYDLLKQPFIRPKIFAVIPGKYPVSTSGGGYDISTVKHYEQQFHHAPAHYEFQYQVHDHHHGSQFGHAESRHGDVAKGQYMVLLPDGRRQIVDYIADSHGYRPTIRYEGGHEKIGYGR